MQDTEDKVAPPFDKWWKEDSSAICDITNADNAVNGPTLLSCRCDEKHLTLRAACRPLNTSEWPLRWPLTQDTSSLSRKCT